MARLKKQRELKNKYSVYSFEISHSNYPALPGENNHFGRDLKGILYSGQFSFYLEGKINYFMFKSMSNRPLITVFKKELNRCVQF